MYLKVSFIPSAQSLEIDSITFDVRLNMASGSTHLISRGAELEMAPSTTFGYLSLNIAESIPP